MMDSFTEKWYQKNKRPLGLLPLSSLFCSVAAVRRFCYRIHLKKTKNFPVPIIVVGNLTVGGTGKTPLVIILAQLLRYHGYKPGIVSRGYGGKAKNFPTLVEAHSNPTLVGDEAILLARETMCPVIVSSERVKAVDYLLHNFDCNIVISDDGLQHYALARDIEIVVIDGERRFGNGRCLPAGPLREPLSRLKKVDFKITNGEAHEGEYAMQVYGDIARNLLKPELQLAVSELKHAVVHAIAGIGNPQRFFNMLKNQDLTIREHPFPDHYAFTANDFINIPDDEIILMTEKDAVKCENFAKANYWCLPVNAGLDEKFSELFLQKVKNSAEKKLKSI